MSGQEDELWERIHAMEKVLEYVGQCAGVKSGDVDGLIGWADSHRTCLQRIAELEARNFELMQERSTGFEQGRNEAKMLLSGQIERLQAENAELREELRWYGRIIAGGGPVAGYRAAAKEAEARWYSSTLPMLDALRQRAEQESEDGR